MSRFARIALAAAEAGLDVSACREGGDSIVLFSPLRRAMWPVFAASPEAADGAPDPLDRWSRRVIGAIGAPLGAEVILPSDGPPYPPFLRWAQAAEPVWASVPGPMIHARKGLWVSWRGALRVEGDVGAPARPAAERPCDRCIDKPCLAACPVGAFRAGGYDVDACAGWAGSPSGADCAAAGCLARHACPVGRRWAPPPPQAALHMAAFLAARPRRD